MWAVFLVTSALAGCDILNDVGLGFYNSDCNNIGRCIEGDCYCCDTSVERDPCRGRGLYKGKWNTDPSKNIDCGYPTNFLTIKFNLLFEDADIFCPNNGSSAIPDFRREVSAVLQEEGYTGEIIARTCSSCTASTPCDMDSDDNPTSGTLLGFGTNLNTYYNLSCAQLTPNPFLGIVVLCPFNTDYGAEAFRVLNSAIDETNDFQRFTESLAEKIEMPATITRMNSIARTAKASSTIVTRNPTSEPTAPTILPTMAPTSSPTSIPSVTPTESRSVDTPFCESYVNKVGDLRFIAGGASCRAHINESWPGGRTCESPYIVCLPQENTPAIDIMGKPYRNITHRYTVLECKQECSYDQRCLGIEFRADNSSVTGDCLLLDDLEPKVEDEVLLFQWSDTFLYERLDKSVTGSSALCWTKLSSPDYCNPFSQAEDLSDEMLNCYCPNNRKGFYTKKVKRTVNNTRFCDNDTTVDERIQTAQANRMFHLCENWCLFDPLQPEQENFYWDPWKQCWRETYSARGSHRAYCDRVIRNPNSIELRYIKHRSTHFCGSPKPPTSSPVPDANTTWYLSDALESCDEVCGRNGLLCAAEQTSRRFKTESELVDAFDEAGFDCSSDSVGIIMNDTRYAGWALPGVRGSTLCVNRQQTMEHLMDMDSDCVRKIGSGWQRLCACY